MRVECYAGYRGDERPVALWIGPQRIVVQTLLETWLTEVGACFHFLGQDGLTYVLRRDDRHDRWELIQSARQQDRP